MVGVSKMMVFINSIRNYFIIDIAFDLSKVYFSKRYIFMWFPVRVILKSSNISSNELYHSSIFITPCKFIVRRRFMRNG